MPGAKRQDCGGRWARSDFCRTTFSLPIHSDPAPREIQQYVECLFHLLYLIVPSDNTKPSALPGQVPGVVSPDKSAEPSPAVSEDKSNWRSTTVATAKLLLRGVRDSADAFGPLKSVAGGLCFFLENYEVWLAPLQCLPSMFTSTPANECEQTSNRIVGAASQSSRGIALQARFGV